MSKEISYQVQHRDNCRLIFGHVPLNDVVALLNAAADHEMMDTHLASLTGAALVIGDPEALKRLRQADDLPVNPARTQDREAALDAGLPPAFADWLYRGERGASSDFIAYQCTGIPSDQPLAYPRDCADFKRCLGVIDALEDHLSEREILNTLAQSCEQWRGLTSNWNRLKDMAREEASEACNHTMDESLAP